MFIIRSRNSSAVEHIATNPITGYVDVVFNNGLRYEYDNVSRRAIIKFILDDARSLGKFINVVLKQSRVDVFGRGGVPTYVLGN